MDQDELDRLERERREKEQGELAAQEALNYLRVHDADASAMLPAAVAELDEETGGQE